MKRFLKRCVFKFRLKISRLFDFRISKGNLFHKKGAHILKARHPYVLFVTFVSFLCNKSRSGLADRRQVLPGTYKSIKRVKYIGAWLFKILYTNINNLKTSMAAIPRTRETGLLAMSWPGSIGCSTFCGVHAGCIQ